MISYQTSSLLHPLPSFMAPSILSFEGTLAPWEVMFCWVIFAYFNIWPIFLLVVWSLLYLGFDDIFGTRWWSSHCMLSLSWWYDLCIESFEFWYDMDVYILHCVYSISFFNYYLKSMNMNCLYVVFVKKFVKMSVWCLHIGHNYWKFGLWHFSRNINISIKKCKSLFMLVLIFFIKVKDPPKIRISYGGYLLTSYH